MMKEYEKRPYEEVNYLKLAALVLFRKDSKPVPDLITRSLIGGGSFVLYSGLNLSKAAREVPKEIFS